VLNRGYSEKRGTFWNCRCSCGTITVVRGDALRQGKTTSCGCYSREIRFKDLTGKRFGDWEVLRLSDNKDKEGKLIWVCKCHGCGNIHEVLRSNLISGNKL